MRDHFERWNKWRKRNRNSKLYKFLVLIGFIKSPTMSFTLTDKEEREVAEAFERGLKAGEVNVKAIFPSGRGSGSN